MNGDLSTFMLIAVDRCDTEEPQRSSSPDAVSTAASALDYTVHDDGTDSSSYCVIILPSACHSEPSQLFKW